MISPLSRPISTFQPELLIADATVVALTNLLPSVAFGFATAPVFWVSEVSVVVSTLKVTVGPFVPVVSITALVLLPFTNVRLSPGFIIVLSIAWPSALLPPSFQPDVLIASATSFVEATLSPLVSGDATVPACSFNVNVPKSTFTLTVEFVGSPALSGVIETVVPVPLAKFTVSV